MDPTERIDPPSGEPEQYTPEEEATLTRNLSILLNAVSGGAFSHLGIEQRVLQAFHTNIFHKIRSHAGRTRSPDFGSEYLTFGPHRSKHRDDVPGLLQDLFSKAATGFQRLVERDSDEDYESDAIEFALWLHAEVIRIHPFEDGNGRSSRALMDFVLVKFGLRITAFEVPKQEYLACLNHYYQTGDLNPLKLLTILSYENDLESE